MDTARRRRPNLAGEHREEGDQKVKDEVSSSSASLSSYSSQSVFSAVFASERRVWYLCLGFRLINALLVQTYFNPDEHWQALEVAHRIVFGYGHLTWEWKKGIRSYFHPLIFALFYKILALLHLDTPLFMVKGPRLVQAMFSSVGDLYIYKLAKLIFDEKVARWTLFCQLVNWFTFFCITRTLSNCLETVFTVVGLFYWLSATGSYKPALLNSRKIGLFIAALACATRPTSAITWLYIGFQDLLYMRDKLKFLFLDVLPIGFLVLSLTLLLDRWMYGSWVLVPLNFLKFNFLSSGGDYYGTHKWHWYFTQGFTVMLFTFLPFSLVGIFQSKEWRLSGLIVWVLGTYSILGHKEFRFVLPVLPLALVFSGYALASLSNPHSSATKRRGHETRVTKAGLATSFLILSNLPMATYMSLVHQRGSEDVMYFLSKVARDGKVKSVMFLMPCHSTPYYSTLHHNLPMRFLDCSPSENNGLPDESDRFMMDPVHFVSLLFKNSSLPSHIVLFDFQERQLKDLLMSHSYTEIQRFFHAHFKVDRHRQASVVVYAHHDQKEI